MQIGARGTLTYSGGVTSVANNAYNNGTNWKHTAAAYSGLYAISDNTHVWYTGDFGSADTNITFTQAMTLDASGNLGVGTTSPLTKVEARGTPDANWGNALLFDNRTVAINQGGVLAFGGYKTTTTSQSTFAQIAGRKENATSANEAGYLAFITNDNTSYVERARISSAGGFSVGTTADPGAGAIYATGNITAYYSSDIKFKENVRNIPDALATVNAIGGKLFDWTDDYIESKGGADGYFVQKADFGVVAQDVQKVFPIAVRTREDGSLAVDYEKLGALAFAALVELTKRVEALEAKG
jgi:hypothetical protein